MNDILSNFNYVQLMHVLQHNNSEVDKLAKISSYLGKGELYKNGAPPL